MKGWGLMRGGWGHSVKGHRSQTRTSPLSDGSNQWPQRKLLLTTP